MDSLYSMLFGLARKRRPDYKGVLALTLRAQMTAVFGSGVKKSPVKELAPEDGRMITDPLHFVDWFEVDLESRHHGVTALICGIGADLKADLSGYDEQKLNSVFYLHPANVGDRAMLLHNHAVIFNDLPMTERPVNLEQEIETVVARGDFIDMRHLLDSSKLKRAAIGISYIHGFRDDPHGQAGH